MGCQEDCNDEGWSRGDTCQSKTEEKFTTEQQGLALKKSNSKDNYFEEQNISFSNNGQEKLSTNGKVTNKSNLWFYQGQEINLTKFLRFHPGGTPPIKSRRGIDLEPSMKLIQHSSEAFYLLRDFYNGNAEEDIVDWSKPMLGQVGSLGPLYESWVWSPVDRPLRLFQYDWLEKLTRTNWRQVVSVWVPVIVMSSAFSFYYSPLYLSLWARAVGVILSVVCGLAVWPLLEYSIHRWIFHLQPPKNSALLITIHFGLHGLHHKVPFDEGRLLFPPGPCTVMAIALYKIYTRLFPWWIAVAFFSGTMLGYLVYDLIHYYLHHGNPKEGSYLYHMKRYHNQHHFAQQEQGFGISSDFWDHAFDSLIKLKKLSKPLTWETR